MNALKGIRGYIGLSLAWLAVLAGALFVSRQPSGQPIEIASPPTALPTATPAPTSTRGPLRVDVSGAVRSPGVYSLPAGAIVADALAAAGGPATEADLDRLNKATPLQDGMQVHVPRVAQAGPTPPTLSTAAAPAAASPTKSAGGAATHLININTATLEELDTLPGVGPATAQKIVEGRPYAAVDDLLRVKGIGQATFEKLRDLVTVR